MMDYLEKIMEAIDNLKRNGLSFDDLYDYLFCIYSLGEYRDINIQYTNFEGSEYLTIAKKNKYSFSEEKFSMYRVMHENTPFKEFNAIRYFDEDGKYVENATLKNTLDFFNKEYQDDLRIYHRCKILNNGKISN